MVEIGEWVLTIVFLIIYRGPLFAFYNTNLIRMSRETHKKLKDVEKWAAAYDETAEGKAKAQAMGRVIPAAAPAQATVEVEAEAETEEANEIGGGDDAGIDAEEYF